MDVLSNRVFGCIGTGNMGSAIIAGLSQAIAADRIICYDIETEKLKSIQDRYGITIAGRLEDLVKQCDTIIFAVKPDVLPSILVDIKELIADQLIVSIAAGVSINDIGNRIGTDKRIVRVMPNTPALIGEGMSVISARNADDQSIEIVREIFTLLGTVLVLPEKHMDAVTALSGCGPAYGFTLIQAMADGGVKMGIPRDKAIILAAQTIAGAARLVLESGEEPIVLRGRVTSPGGSTIDAVHILERAGFAGIVMDAVERATIKSKELGKHE